MLSKREGFFTSLADISAVLLDFATDDLQVCSVAMTNINGTYIERFGIVAVDEYWGNDRAFQRTANDEYRMKD